MKRIAELEARLAMLRRDQATRTRAIFNDMTKFATNGECGSWNVNMTFQLPISLDRPAPSNTSCHDTQFRRAAARVVDGDGRALRLRSGLRPETRRWVQSGTGESPAIVVVVRQRSRSLPGSSFR